MVVIILPFKQGVCQSPKDLELSYSLILKKDKNLEFLKNWRPITLLNTGYKVATGGLASFTQINTCVLEKSVGFSKDFLRTPSSILF